MKWCYELTVLAYHRHWGFDYLSKETIHINSLASIVRFD